MIKRDFTLVVLLYKKLIITSLTGPDFVCVRVRVRVRVRDDVCKLSHMHTRALLKSTGLVQ